MTSTTSDTLAIDGGTPVRSEPFPERPSPPPSDATDPAAALEAELSLFLGSNTELIACRDGAAAYALALEVLGITEGEAIVPALAATPAVEAARSAGLILVPAEVEAESIGLGTRPLARALSDNTRVIFASHAFGHPYTASELQRVVADRVPIIEDGSSALGGEARGRPVGLLGTVAVFAFGPSHLIQGHGAVLTTTDPALAARLRDARYRAGLQIAQSDAQIALSCLLTAEDELSVRRQLAWELTFDLRAMKAVSGMPHSRWVKHGYDCYLVRFRGLMWKRTIEDLLAALRAEGIPCEPALEPSLHRNPDIRATLGDDERLARDAFPVARRLPDELIALSLHGGMTDREIADITAALEKLQAARK